MWKPRRKTLHVLQARFTRVVREQARNQNIKELSAFVDFAGHAVLYQIFAFQLLNGSIKRRSYHGRDR
ncbi:hypothetical protein DMI69_14350 [Escherichia coli]|nr:hypothetical protein [Escherichia coli]